MSGFRAVWINRLAVVEKNAKFAIGQLVTALRTGDSILRVVDSKIMAAGQARYWN